MSIKTKVRELLKGIKSFLKEYRTLLVFLLLIVGITFGLSRLVLADTVTVKYKFPHWEKERSFSIRKGSTIYLDPNSGYFKKDNNKRTKKIVLNNDLDLTNNYDINTNPYAVARQNDSQDDLISKTEAPAWGKNTTFSSIKTMQEMTPDICKNETIPTKDARETTTIHSVDTNLVPEARLKDTRDNRYYKVRKLADGSCWMVDNLVYAKIGALSPADSDVADNNFALNDAEIRAEEGDKWKYTEYDHILIYNKSSYALNGWRKTRLSDGSISMKAIYKDLSLKRYGNFYTWSTATAGSYEHGAKSSICPKGWQLPLGGGYSFNPKSYSRLFRTYGFTSSFDYNFVNRGKETTLSSPMDFSLAGQYFGEDGKVYNIDRNAAYWVRDDRGIALTLTLNERSDVLINVRQRFSADYGLSMRCVAR